MSLKVTNLPIKNKSLIFAPMEGITDFYYRKVIDNLYPEWDILYTDFLRVSSVAKYPDKHLIKHLGVETYQEKSILKKTVFQILASDKSLTSEICQQLTKLEIPWLDINLGCPSKTVVKRKGGSFILSDPELLKNILQKIRSNYSGVLTAKIRLGFEDDKLFLENLKIIEDLGFDAITIHARTRAQLYKGRADWNYIKQAVEFSKIPIIGNGDIWTINDINEIFSFSNCHSVMIARGALKAPWLATYYRKKQDPTLCETSIELKKYFNALNTIYQNHNFSEYSVLKKFKSLSRYIFKDYQDCDELQKLALRSMGVQQFLDVIASLK